VVDFVETYGLRVIESNPDSRSIIVSGTVRQMSDAFSVFLGKYQHTLIRHRGRRAFNHQEVYRGRDGVIQVHGELAEIITGIFGLDKRTVTKRNAADPPNTGTVSIQQVAKLYNYPTNSAAGQTIGICSPSAGQGGYFDSDMQQYFGAAIPTITPISVDGTTRPFGYRTKVLLKGPTFVVVTAVFCCCCWINAGLRSFVMILFGASVKFFTNR
jgi:kumamolisin